MKKRFWWSIDGIGTRALWYHEKPPTFSGKNKKDIEGRWDHGEVLPILDESAEEEEITALIEAVAPDFTKKGHCIEVYVNPFTKGKGQRKVMREEVKKNDGSKS